MCGGTIFNQVRGSVPLLPSYRAHSHYALLMPLIFGQQSWLVGKYDVSAIKCSRYLNYSLTLTS